MTKPIYPTIATRNEVVHPQAITGLVPNVVPEKYRGSVKSLAISYAAFTVACTSRDHDGVATWGRMLLEDQEACGVIMIDPALIRSTVDRFAQTREARRLALAA